MLRVRDQVSILYAAGCLASTLSIFPFSETQVRNAALLVLELWLSERGGVEAHEDREAVEIVRGFIQTNQHRLMRPITDATWSTPPKPIGYCLEEGRLFAIFPQTWKEEACLGPDAKQVAERLITAGYLQAETSKGQISKVAKKITIGEGRQRLVCISAAILTVKGEERDPLTTKFLRNRVFIGRS